MLNRSRALKSGGLLNRNRPWNPSLRLFLSTSSEVATPTTKKDAFYITTPIYYVNGEPHLGHAYTSVVSDVIARFQRKNNKNVYFLTGTDEHGQKVEQSANKNGQTPLEFADKVSDRFRQLSVVLNCSNDDFIRTTEERHQDAVCALWKKLEEKGQIYLGAYEGWYSIRDEAFYAESEIIDGKAPTGAEVEWVKEESYFFKLSDYTQKLLNFYDNNPDFIAPKSRRNEVISFVQQEGGLKDLSISRTTFSWGIPVPGSKEHVVYVWLDALTNYIAAIDYAKANDEKYETFWPADLHVVGKDILRFHCIFWPAFLIGAGLEPPKRVFAHGWWTKDGEKMSKSIGNVLDPFELLQKYSVDYLRYFLCAEIPFGNDGDFSDEAFTGRINSDLANDVGNLAQRAVTFINKNCEGYIPVPGQQELPFTVMDMPPNSKWTTLSGLQPPDIELLEASDKTLINVKAMIDRQQLKPMCEEIINLSKLGNKYIDMQAPWALKKTDVARMHSVLFTLVETIRRIAVLLEPIVPSSSVKLMEQIGCYDLGGDENQYTSFDSFDTVLPPGAKVRDAQPVFPKIEKEKDASGNEIASKKKKKAKVKVNSQLESVREEYKTTSKEIMIERIVEQGDHIRSLKNSGAEKDIIQENVDKLLALKIVYEEKGGSL
jgi:methionyl-tRNA synthetase